MSRSRAEFAAVLRGLGWLRPSAWGRDTPSVEQIVNALIQLDCEDPDIAPSREEITNLSREFGVERELRDALTELDEHCAPESITDGSPAHVGDLKRRNIMDDGRINYRAKPALAHRDLAEEFVAYLPARQEDRVVIATEIADGNFGWLVEECPIVGWAIHAAESAKQRDENRTLFAVPILPRTLFEKCDHWAIVLPSGLVCDGEHSWSRETWLEELKLAAASRRKHEARLRSAAAGSAGQ